jgi:thiol-disulfide isomerase/thioredoxin
MKRILVIALLWAFCLPAQAFGLQAVPVRPAPPLVVPLATGGYVDLAKLRGRVVLVNYWASWCPPCLMEMPSLDRLARLMGKYPFVLLAVNAGESPGWVQGFLKRTRPGFPVGLDAGSRYMHAWGGVVMPTSFLVDKAGRIRYSVIGPVEWDSPEMLGIIANLLRE